MPIDIAYLERIERLTELVSQMKADLLSDNALREATILGELGGIKDTLEKKSGGNYGYSRMEEMDHKLDQLLIT